MTTLSDYTDKVPSQNAAQPNFLAVLAAVLQPSVDLQNQLEALPGLLDLDVASGDQLDIIGEWVGLTRRLRVPILGVYFAFDTVGVGFDAGVWFSGADPSSGLIALDDVTYRQMVLAKIAANTWDGSLGDANAKLLAAFPAADVFLQDNFDMTETFILSGTAPSTLFAQLVAQGYIQLKPAAVNLV